ncbi:MAG: triose-phosphate isomerase [Patescibacteria group bacterium]|nr:triose-phosphate isomerase [Patescibacteria group bacterium]
MTKKLIMANWKMNLGLKDSIALASAYQEKFKNFTKADVVVCPSEFALSGVLKALKKSVALGAQNVFWQLQGAYTGEVSATMLEELGCQYVIIGHSERRQYLSESCRLVNLKLKSVLGNTKITPVVCVGENLAKRKANSHITFVSGQIKRALAGVKFDERLVIAYEPIWAIGTGVSATTADAQEMHAAIRSVLKRLYKEKGDNIRILYGGSVSALNAKELLKTPNVDGLLVGGASLKINDFGKIVNSA